MSITKPVLIKTEYDDLVLGGKSYCLTNRETIEAVPFYTEYLNDLKRKGTPPNSIDSYRGDLYIFYSYLAVASELIVDLEPNITAPLVDLLGAFPEFLVLGKNSHSQLIQQTSNVLGWKPVGNRTKNRILSTLNNLLAASASYQKIQQELTNLGLLETICSPDIFAEQVLQKRKLSSFEKKALLHKSFLAGCIAHGPQLLKSSFYNFKKAEDTSSDLPSKAFPIENCLELINNATSLRDQALWSLLLGTGIRVSEAFCLLSTDIDVANKKVYINDPNKRIAQYPIKSGRVAKLPFKGRQTNETYFLEPFRSIFFDALRAYMKNERPETSHKVLFVTNANNDKGSPLYFASNNSALNKQFKKAAEKVGILGYAPHSLRHTYGVIALNFIPTSDGYGLPLKTVQEFMGHSSINSTAQYAVKDETIKRAELENFNKLVTNKGLRIEEIRKDTLERLGHQ